MICLGSLSLVAAAAAPATAEHEDGPLVAPVAIAENNPTCGALSDSLDGADDWVELKYENGQLKDTATNQNSDLVDVTIENNVVSFVSDIPLDAVLVKAGSLESTNGVGHNLYWYDSPTGPGEVDHDNGLVTATGLGVSHISFCHDTDPTPEPWNLSITKDVGGTDAPETWSFNFDVECGEGGDAITETITLTNDTDTGGVDDIPEGVDCTVTETAATAAGFVVSHSSDGEVYAAGSTASAEAQSPEVFFLNTRDAIITTTTLPPTTTTLPPTTTTLPPTTTTLPPEVEPTQFGPFPNSPDPIFQEVDEPEILPDTLVKTPPTVLGEVFTKAPAAAVLARTGTSSSALAAFAAILILLGIVMLVPFRRRELQA